MAANIGDIVLVTNNDKTDLALQWDGRVYNIPAGKTAMASFDAVAARFGNPYAAQSVAQGTTEFGQPFYVPSRQQEINRLIVRYGVPLVDYNGGVPPMPDVTVTDQDGNPIFTVAHDPSGKQASPLNAEAPSSQDQINRLERQLQMLKAQVESNNPSLAIPGVTPSTNTDEGADSVPRDE